MKMVVAWGRMDPSAAALDPAPASGRRKLELRWWHHVRRLPTTAAAPGRGRGVGAGVEQLWIEVALGW
jgi:hypothetical protein